MQRRKGRHEKIGDYVENSACNGIGVEGCNRRVGDKNDTVDKQKMCELEET